MASSSRCDEKVQINFPRLGKGENIITRRGDAIGRVPQRVIQTHPWGGGGSLRDWSLGRDRHSVVLPSRSKGLGHYRRYMQWGGTRQCNRKLDRKMTGGRCADTRGGDDAERLGRACWGSGTTRV